MKVDGIRLPAPIKTARRLRPLIQQIVSILKDGFSFWPGVFVENKGLSLSVHYRNIKESRIEAFEALIAFFQEKFKASRVCWRRGKKVWEVRPDIRWGKGDMVRYLLEQRPDYSYLVVGDDRTDEDMFKTLRAKAITVRVGFSRATAAKYCLKHQTEVKRLLECL